MTKKTKKTILLTIVLLILAGVCIGYYLWNKPHKDVKHASAEKVPATVLYQTFNTDSAKAKTLYMDKILQVSGEVTQVTTNQQQQQVILLKTNTADASINCTMEENATGISVGQQINIKGICSGYIAGDPEMDLPGDVIITRGYHIK